MIPGNFLGDNWYMGNAPVAIDSLGHFKELTAGFSGEFVLTNPQGKSLQIRVGHIKGTLVVEASDERPT